MGRCNRYTQESVCLPLRIALYHTDEPLPRLTFPISDAQGATKVACSKVGSCSWNACKVLCLGTADRTQVLLYAFTPFKNDNALNETVLHWFSEGKQKFSPNSGPDFCKYAPKPSSAWPACRIAVPRDEEMDLTADISAWLASERVRLLSCRARPDDAVT